MNVTFQYEFINLSVNFSRTLQAAVTSRDVNRPVMYEQCAPIYTACWSSGRQAEILEIQTDQTKIPQVVWESHVRFTTCVIFATTACDVAVTMNN